MKLFVGVVLGARMLPALVRAVVVKGRIGDR